MSQDPVAWRYWKDKFACWEYSDTPLVFPAVPAGTKMEPLYAATDARIQALEADNRAAWATNRAIDKARMEDRARADKVAQDAIRLYQGLVRARQPLFPHIDQEEVMARDFPLIAALKS